MATTDTDIIELPARRGIAHAATGAMWLVGFAALALTVTAVVAFAWGAARVWSLVQLLIDEGSDSKLAIVRLLEVIDIFLLGVVLVILAIGIVELFIARLDLPAWLVIRDLSDLKGKFIDVLQLVAAIKFLEKAVTAKDALEVLWFGLAVSVVIGVLLAVRVLRSSSDH